MAKTKSEILITQSLVDRLTDVEEWPETRAASINMYRNSLKRDLEWLLNTRQPEFPVIPDLDPYPGVEGSIYNFGLPDIHKFNGSAGRNENDLTLALERCIRTFEPRIKDPRVTLSRSDKLSRSIRFHIEGSISFENFQEEIKFDTVLELVSGDFEVK